MSMFRRTLIAATAVAGLKISNPALDKIGKFKTESVPISVIGMNQIKVQQMLDRVGYK